MRTSSRPPTSGGRYQEAVFLLKKHLADYPNQPWGHAALIVTYVELGRDQEARAEAFELKRISPTFSAYAMANKNPIVTKRWQDDLRKAGVT